MTYTPQIDSWGFEQLSSLCVSHSCPSIAHKRYAENISTEQAWPFLGDVQE